MPMTRIWRNFRENKDLYNAAAQSHAFIVFDTETTGLKKDDEIIELACLKTEYKDGCFKEYERLHEYIRPSKIMDESAIAVHGITNEFLADKPTAQELFPKIHHFLGDSPVMGAYNSRFDIRMLGTLYRQCGHEFHIGLEVDLLKIAKDILCEQKLKDHKLATVTNYYGVDKDIQFHTAIDDTIVLLRLANAMMKDMQENGSDSYTEPLRHLSLFQLRFWEGYRGHSRLYAITSGGSIYYDFVLDTWAPNVENCIDLSKVDMEDLEKQVFEKAAKASPLSIDPNSRNYKDLFNVCRNGAFSNGYQKAG